MSKIEQINEIYAFIKATVIDNECTESQTRNILDSDVMSKLVVNHTAINDGASGLGLIS